MLVIGGGITGAGIARDAALRGLRTALVERDDFASGTSSRSSRLVHGGVRYLEHGQVRLVFESSRERRTLLRIAPHLVRPLAFTWPVYRGARVPRWKLAAGLTLYDALSLFRNPKHHEQLGPHEVHAVEPALRTDTLLGGARYWDAATDDARLTLATVLSAVQAGAVAINHTRATSLVRHEGRIAGATVESTVSGETTRARARVVVNATGPWSDTVERMAEHEVSSSVRGSKGVHVSVPRERVGNVAAVTLIAPQDGRVMFVLPAGRHAIIGTTDSYDATAPDAVHATSGDVAYLLEAANHYFPEARLTRADVVSAWAGIRPLAASGATTGDPSSASREHAIVESAPGLVRVTGGKLTTYRSMAEEVVDVVERALGHTPRATMTAKLPLCGGDIRDVNEEIAHAVKATGDEAIAQRLVHAYGTAWQGVWSLTQADPGLGSPIEQGLPYLFAELLHAITHEQAATLGDLLIRRTPIAFETHDHGRGAASRIAPVVARWLRWSATDLLDAVTDYDAESRRMFGIEER
ncbi:MAG TPA: glycerol-3-phosphate dehydrogenase/oxidase [Gemmatimonadaceae bacterium]|nr:glycerol-3-phosphate dehydrogenase/oxidase [Gemmatimonadaceae bacterium]